MRDEIAPAAVNARKSQGRALLSRARNCACGCDRLIVDPPLGRRRVFATPACRMAAHRRRIAGLALNTPRRRTRQGRRALRNGLSLADLTGPLRPLILASAERYGLHNVRVFGSTARRVETPQSDVDFVVDVEPGRSVLALGGFLSDMQELLETRVDVVEGRALRTEMRDRVLREAVPV